MISKPTFVIVHGAWHPLSCYSTLVNSLQATGYPAMTISYPSLNTGDPFTATCAADSDSIRQQLISVMEKDGGKNIVVIAHSYGGVPGSAGARGLGKSTRMKEGKAGGVIGLICMCAILVPEGTSLKEFLGGNASFQVEDQPSPGYCSVSSGFEAFYQDVELSIAREMESSLLPMASKAFDSPSPPAAWAEPAYAGKLAYLKCNQDKAILPSVQDHFMTTSGAKWRLAELESSHSPFASRPQETAKIFANWAAIFQEMHL